jgi:formylglycine-generating enzyme required for sulfatase activity
MFIRPQTWQAKQVPAHCVLCLLLLLCLLPQVGAQAITPRAGMTILGGHAAYDDASGAQLVPLVSPDGETQDSSDDWTAGKVDLTGLEPGHHTISIEVGAAATGGVSEPLLLDVFIYEDAWQHSDAERDIDRDGLPDRWELQHFGVLSHSAGADPDGDGLSNLQELSDGSLPDRYNEPADGAVFAEYFVDTDPGVGRAIPWRGRATDLPADCSDWQLPAIDSSNLLPGYHQIGIRLKKGASTWAPVRLLDFFVYEDTASEIPEPKSIVEIESYWEHFVSEGGGLPLPLRDEAVCTDAVSLAAATSRSAHGIAEGWTRLYFRGLDSNGNYGAPFGSAVEVRAADSTAVDAALEIDTILGVTENVGENTVLVGSSITASAPLWYDYMGQRYALEGAIGTGGLQPYVTEGSVWGVAEGWSSLTWLWARSQDPVSFVNDRGFGTGQGLQYRYSMMRAAVPEYVYEDAQTRYRCIGYTVEGSGLSGGDSNEILFMLMEATSITWLWEKQYRVQVLSRNGQVEGWDEWYAAGSDTALTALADDGYVFDSWGGALAGSAAIPGTFRVSAPASVVAHFKPAETASLRVIEIDGSERTLEYAVGSLVSLGPEVLESALADGVREVPSGWKLEGSFYGEGEGLNPAFYITRSTVLRWQAVRQVYLDPVVLPEAGGEVVIEGRQTGDTPGWYDAGRVRVRAVNSNGYRFVEWYPQEWSEAAAEFNLFDPIPIMARFAEVRGLGHYVTVDGGALASPNSAVAHFEPILPTTRFKQTEVTAAEYAVFLNSALTAGWIEASNYVSVRGQNPLRESVVGLKAEWFEGNDWSGEPIETGELDALAFDFGLEGPATHTEVTTDLLTAVDFFTLRARGEIYIPNPGVIHFRVNSTDDCILAFDSSERLNNASGAIVDEVVAVTVAAAGWYPFEVIFMENVDAASLSIEWNGSESGIWEGIAPSYLRHQGLSAASAAQIDYYQAHTFYHGLELLDLDTDNVNIELVEGRYQAKAGAADLPVVDVTYFGALAYCDWLAEATGEQVTLPSEFAWEYAASGGDSNSAANYYPWGPVFFGASHSKANYVGVGGIDLFDGLSPVGTFPLYANLHDMAGNVFEWTKSTNEVSDQDNTFRMLRGGSWNQPSGFLATSNRQIYKDERFSDQATGFRPIVEYRPQYTLPGYKRVEVSISKTSSNDSAAAYSQPADPYYLAYDETNNRDYAAFLNWAVDLGYLTVEGANVRGSATSWVHPGALFYLIDPAGGIRYENGTFKARPGREQAAANFVTWFGADAYCAYLEALDPSRDYTLPTEWEWEYTMLAPAADARFGDVNYFGDNLPVAATPSFWTAFWNVTAGLQEWTQTIREDLDGAWRVVRGGAGDLYMDYQEVEKAQQYARSEDARKNIGFRVAIRQLAPQIKTSTETIALSSNGDSRTVALTGYSLKSAPEWNWSLNGAPEWVTLSAAEAGQAYLEFVPPAAETAGQFGVVLSDGGLVTELEMRYAVGSGLAAVIRGLPRLIETHVDGPQQDYILELESVAEVDREALLWSLSESLQGLSLSPLDDGRARLVVAGGALGGATVRVSVSGSGVSVSQEFNLQVLSGSLKITEVPERIVFKNNESAASVLVLAQSQKPEASLNWSVIGASGDWAQFTDAVGHSAILEVSRDGFVSSGGVEIQVSDGTSVVNATIEVAEEMQLVRTLTDIEAIDIVAGSVAEQVLLIYGDENISDELVWSLANAPAGTMITKYSERSAILTVDPSYAVNDLEMVVHVTDGVSSLSHTIDLSIANTAPILLEGAEDWVVDSSEEEGGRLFTLFDPDYSQQLEIQILDAPAWLDWYYVSNRSIRVQPNEVFDGSRDFSIRLADGVETVDHLINVSYPSPPDALSLDGPTDTIRLERFAPRKKLPLKLNGVDGSSELLFEIISAPPGIHLESVGHYAWNLVVDAIAEEGAYRIALRAHSETQDEYFTLDLNIGARSTVGHELKKAEYFIDVEPAPGTGSPLFITDNKVFRDASSYAALINETKDLAVGHHRIGFRVQSANQTWSSVYWSDFFVYDTAERVGVLVERPDGNVSYGKWAEFSGFGTAAALSESAATVVDLNPSQTLVTTDGSVVEDTDGVVNLDTSIHWGEYFIDVDPGVGLAMPMPLDSRDFESDALSFQFDFDSSPFEPGPHLVGVRLKEITGEWSETRYLDVIIYADEEKEIPENVAIVDTEYFWDEPGSEGFGFSLPLSVTAPISEIGLIASEPVQTSSVDTGMHTLGYRFKTNTNKWSQNRIEFVEVALEDAPLSLFNLHLESNLGLPGLGLDSLHISGTSINLHVPQTYDLDGLIYANFGFIGQGSAPSFGQENFVSFDITEASDVTWIWGRECQVTGRTGHETVSGTAPWLWYDAYNTGYGVFEPLQLVTLSVPEISVINDSERYRSDGWLGSGSIPSVGSAHTVTFIALAESSEIDWQWEKQYRVTAEIVGNGAVFGNREWYDENEQAELSAVASEGYEFRRWELHLAGTSANASISVDQPKAVRAVFTEHRLWEVDPVTLERRLVGTYEDGEMVEHEIAESLSIGAGSRFMVGSWRGAGSVPSSGTGNVVSFQIHADSEIRWDGERQHWLDVRVNNPQLGNIYINEEPQSASSGWVSEGNFLIEALAENGSRFVRWLDSLNGMPANQTVLIDAPVVLSAVFRDTNLSPPEMVEIKGRSIASSSNHEVVGFTEWVETFELGKYEVTNQFMVDELNRAYDEGSLYVSDDKVYGKAEFMPYWAGVMVESFDSESQVVSDYKRVQSVNDLNLISQLESLEGDSYQLSGEVFTHSQQVAVDWSFEGSGTVSLVWNGETVLDTALLPASVSLDTSDEWVEFALIYNSAPEESGGCHVNVQVSPAASGAYSKLEFRHKDPSYQLPVVFTQGVVGQSAEAAAAATNIVYYDRDETIPSVDGDFTYFPLNSDGAIVAEFERPLSAEYGLMLRSSLNQDAAYVELTVNSFGEVTTTMRQLQGGPVSVHIAPFRLLTDYSLKLGVYNGVATAQVLIDEQWVDVISQTLEILPLSYADSSIAEAPVIGFVGRTDIHLNEWSFLSRSTRQNHNNQILLDLERQNGRVIFDSGTFRLDAPSSSQLPAVGINYLGANQVCSWLSQRLNDYTYQLPSEWEIEAATGVGAGYEYPWPVGSSFSEFAHLSDSSDGGETAGLQSVGGLNSWNGLYDIAGNAWEWTRSPQLEGRGAWFNIRGGSFSQDAVRASNTFRLFYGNLNFASPEVGFRLSRKASVTSDFGFEVNDDLISSSNSEALGFGAYDAAFSAMKHPVPNSDFIAFLNALLVQGDLLIEGGLIYSQAAEYAEGELLIDLNESQQILYTDERFSTVFANDPVTGVTWHAANAYGSWLTQARGDGLYILPTEWEWELLSETGLVSPVDSVFDYGVSSSSSISGYGYLDGVYPSWGVSTLLTGPGEWVASESIADTTYASVRGVHLDQFSQLSRANQRDGYFPKSYSSDGLGFRLIKKAITANRFEGPNGDIIFELDRGFYAPGDSGRITIVFSEGYDSEFVIDVVSSDSRLIVDESVSMPAGLHTYFVDFTVTEGINVLGAESVRVSFSKAAELLGQLDVPIRNVGVPSISLSSTQIELDVGQNASLQVNKPAAIGKLQPVYLTGSAVTAFNLPDHLAFTSAPTQEVLALLASSGVEPGDYYLNLSNPELESASAVITVAGSANLDFDLDGMPDWWELEQGLDEKKDNSADDDDLDGITNFEEFVYDTDPKVFNRKPRLKLFKSGAGHMLFFDASVHRRYMIQVSTDLIHWSDHGEEFNQTDTINVELTISGKKFYRLKVYP